MVAFLQDCEHPGVSVLRSVRTFTRRGHRGPLTSHSLAISESQNSSFAYGKNQRWVLWAPTMLLPTRPPTSPHWLRPSPGALLSWEAPSSAPVTG